MIFVTMMLFFIGYLIATTLQNFGTIYFDLTVLIFILFLGAWASKRKYFTWVLFGKLTNIFKYGAALFAGMFISYLLSSGILTFSIGIPLSILASTVGVNSILNYFTVAFYGPLVEEIFWIGLLVPSMMLFFTNRFGNATIGGFLIIGLIMMFLGAYIGLGSEALLLGILLFGMALLLTIAKVYKISNRIKVNKFMLIMPLAAFIMTIFHVYSYGNILQNLPLFISAYAFFVLEGFIDYKFQSIVPSIMMHTVNNAIVGAELLGIADITLLGIAIPAAWLMILLMALFLTVLFRVRIIFKLPSNGPLSSATQSLITQEGGVY